MALGQSQKGGGGEQERRPKTIACNRVMEIAADANAPTEGLASLANHLAFAPEGCDCLPTLLKGYRAFLAAAKAAEEGTKPKEKAKKAEEQKEEDVPLLQRFDRWGKKFFG